MEYQLLGAAARRVLVGAARSLTGTETERGSARVSQLDRPQTGGLLTKSGAFTPTTDRPVASGMAILRQPIIE